MIFLAAMFLFLAKYFQHFLIVLNIIYDTVMSGYVFLRYFLLSVQLSVW